MTRYLRTLDLARAAQIHPNTVRLYEAWGYLPPVERGANGYRLYTLAHLEQVKLVRLVLRSTWLGDKIGKTGVALIFRSAAGDFDSALQLARELQDLIQQEVDHAEDALKVVEQWVAYQPSADDVPTLKIGEVVRLLNVTQDMLRNWERNGLIEVPRVGRLRVYGKTELDRLRVIRALRSARYGTMSILRMFQHLESGNFRHALDTPAPEEDVGYATDRWLSTLTELQKLSDEIICQLETMKIP